MKIIKILSNEDKAIIKISFIATLIISILLIFPSFFFDWWKWPFFLSVFIGYLASFVCYLKLVYAVFRETSFPSDKSKGAFVLNNISSMLIYCLFLLLCHFVSWLNIFLCFIGMMIIKIVIYILYGKKPKVGEKKE